ncbi:MAG: diaminopimelate epimerase [Myxococcota bacterium]|nr:diaminopimelate epimerase [Myxococcota bacterium]
MHIPFVKLQGAGNGYIAIDGRPLAGLDLAELARHACDPHFGIGSDGLVVARDPDETSAATSPATSPAIGLVIHNSDGSEAEMSGNGVRLFAKFVLDSGLTSAGPEGLVIETRAGLRRVVPELDAAGRMQAGRVGMEEPRILERALSLEAGGRSLSLTTLSLGNPHAVLLTDEPVEDFPLDRIGPAVEHHAHFPDRTNFEVVNVLSSERLRVRVHERGEGETLSSGTGSTASAVAARAAGRTGDCVTVALRGGELIVRWPGHGPAELDGPTTEVFRGVLDFEPRGGAR